MTSNFKKLEILHGSLFWMAEIHSILEPLCVLDLPRLMAHSLSVYGPFDMLVLLLLLLLLSEKQIVQVSLSSIGRGRSPNYLFDDVEVGRVG